LENVKNSQDLIDEFYNRHPNAPKELSLVGKLTGKGKMRMLESGRSLQVNLKDFVVCDNTTAVTTWPGLRSVLQNS
jgi:hypothetical protein